MSGYYHPHGLVIKPHNAGFFSNFNKVMNHLVHAEKNSSIKSIKVDWNFKNTSRGKVRNFPYGSLDDGNIWDHFFEQIKFNRGRVFQTLSTNKYIDRSITQNNAYALYNSDVKWRETYHNTYKTYIRVKPDFNKIVEEFYLKDMHGKYCIGVHIRH